MNDAKERIIKTMQERGITKVNLVMTWAEWAKENGFDPAEEPDDDYTDYRNQEAPYVIFFNKWSNGMDYAVYSVEMVDGPVEPRFKLDCYNSDEGSEWFYDSELTNLSMIGVYDALERQLGLEEEFEYVYTFTANQATDDEVLDTIIQVFATEEAARKYLHEFVEEGELSYAEKRGWTIEQNNSDAFHAYEEGNYCGNHTEAFIEKHQVKR